MPTSLALINAGYPGRGHRARGVAAGLGPVLGVTSQPRSGTQAIERALTVLRCVEAAEDGLGSTELAQQAKLS